MIIPQRPILSVVEGVAYFGITPNYIKARVLRYSYGVVGATTERYARIAGIPAQHMTNATYKQWSECRQTWLVKGIFHALARKNEEIRTGEIRESTGERVDPQAKFSAKSLMWSKLENPKVCTDGMLLGDILVEYPNNDEDDMQSTLEFHFAETVIKAVVYRNKDPDKKQIRYITKKCIDKQCISVFIVLDSSMFTPRLWVSLKMRSLIQAVITKQQYD